MKIQRKYFMKILFASIIIFLLMLSYKSYGLEALTSEDGLDCTSASDDNLDNQYGGCAMRTYNMTTDGLDYVTSEAAYAAAVAYQSTLNAAYPDYYSSAIGTSSVDFYGQCWDSSKLGQWLVRVYDECNPSSDPHYYVVRAFFYKLPTVPCEQECYVIWKGVKNSSGDWLYAVVVTTQGNVMHYGSRQDAEDCLNGLISGCTIYENPLADYELNNADPETCNNTCDIAGDLDISPSTPSTDPIESSPPTEEKGTEGEPGETGDTDNELLIKIANNTSEIANNTDGLESGLTNLERELKKANSTLDTIANKGDTTNVDTPLTVSQQNAIDNLNNQETMTTEQAEDYAFTESDYGQETTIGSFLDTMKSQNPINGFLSKISVTASDPVCSVNETINFFGHDTDIEFSLCEYEDMLDIMGIIVLLTSAITFCFIVFKL